MQDKLKTRAGSAVHITKPGGSEDPSRAAERSTEVGLNWCVTIVNRAE